MVLLLNGRLLATRDLPRAIPMYGEPCRYVAADGTLLALWAEGERLAELLAGRSPVQWGGVGTELPEKGVEWPLLEWPWELFERNGERITEQADRWPLGERPALRGVHLLDEERVFIHERAHVQPGVVLDASAGPIVIDEGATVMANAVIQGPCYVGRGSSVKIGAKIYHGTTIGPLCKVGGEVEESIFHSYSNKQHDGFLGHAYVGSWCNFGADTNNSDLKNNYSSVKLWCDGAWRDTGSLFVGLLMADHAKTGINTSLNTGTVVGVSCNLFGAGLPPKYLPSFSWGGVAGWTEYRVEDALQTAERVMGRRNVPLTGAEAALLRYIFEATASERA
jgi:UDP-N-acetylglucosamine diphosphorylase/glucosamine-1-phosphate N-acetyltransferase